MARRHRPRSRSVGRLLLRLLVAGGLVAVVWAALGARSMVGSLLRDQLAGDLQKRSTSLATLFANSAATPTEADRFRQTAEVMALHHAILLRPDDRGALRAVGASDLAWQGKQAWSIAMGMPSDFDAVITAAGGKPSISADGSLLQLARRADDGSVLYTAMSTAPIRVAVREATYRALLRAAGIVLAVGLAVWGLLWSLVARPLRRIADEAEGLARRSGHRIALAGPDEVANLASALNALASDAELERQRADQSGQRWRALFDEIPVPSFLLAGNGRVLDANRRALEVTGQTLDALRQRQRSDLTGKDDALRTTDGAVLPVQWAQTRIEHEGRPATLALALDLSAVQPQTTPEDTVHEEWLLDALDEPMIELDDEGLVMRLNDAAAKRLGGGAETLTGVPLREALEIEDRVPAWPEIAAAAQRDGAWMGEVSLRLGAVCHECQLRVAPVFADDGAVRGYVAVVRDLSAARRAEAAAAHAEKMQQMGLLIGAVDRELQEVLRGIMAYAFHAGTMLDTVSPVRVGIESIQSSAKRGMHIFERLVALCRVSILERQQLDVSAMIQEIAAQAMGSSHVSVSVESEPELPSIETDPALLREALLELLRNALDAMPEGGTLQLRARHGATGSVVIEVHDSGAGMEALQLRQAPEPFFTTRPGRRGLGLTRARGIAHLLGGDVTLESAPEQGTTASLTLPLAVPLSSPPVDTPAKVIPEGPRKPQSLEEALVIHPRADGEQSHQPSPHRHAQAEEEEEEFWEERVTSDEIELDVSAPDEFDEEDGEGEWGDEPDDESTAQQHLMLSPEALEEGYDDDVISEEVELVKVEATITEEPVASDTPALLLVDDERIVLDLVRDIFEDEPFEVLAATNGEDALDLMHREGDRVFLAVVDLSLPEMNGWQVAETLARHRPGLSIHIATGYDTRPEDIPASARDAVAGLIKKPFRAGALRDLIERELVR